MQKIRAHWVFDGERLRRDQVVVLNDQDQFLELVPGKKFASLSSFPGMLSVPFVNAHCHLELSALKGLIPTGTGMAGFIRQIQKVRTQVDEATRMEAMENAVQEMYGNGIVMVGDICNGDTSLEVKKGHPEMYFHSFIELFGLDPNQAESAYHGSLELLRQFGKRASITPHAPYSVSPALRDKLIRHIKRREDWPMSIHFMESAAERQLFEELDGPLMEFIRDIGAVFQAHTHPTAWDYLLQAEPQSISTLLVHALELRTDELAEIHRVWPKASFVLCGAANMYIHGKLPDAQRFQQLSPDAVCIGTDSLASNTSLDILGEIRQLQSSSALPTEVLMRWATVNGGRALSPAKEVYPGLRAGHRPCLIGIQGMTADDDLLPPETDIEYFLEPTFN